MTYHADDQAIIDAMKIARRRHGFSDKEIADRLTLMDIGADGGKRPIEARDVAKALKPTRPVPRTRRRRKRP